MTRLTLIRHGETDWNRDRRYQGQTDIPLNETGRQQARQLRSRLDITRFDAIYSSDLKRASQTADILLGEGDLSYKADRRLREIKLGIFEGLTADDIQKKYPDLNRNWYSDPQHTPEGVEPITDMAKRLTTFMTFMRTTHPHGEVLIVSHGGALSLMAALALGVPIPKRWQFRLSNTAVSRLVLFDDAAHLELWNDIHHLTS